MAGLWGMPGPGVMQPNVLTEYLGIKYPKWLDRTNTGGSAFLFHLNHAYQAIKSGIKINCNIFKIKIFFSDKASGVLEKSIFIKFFFIFNHKIKNF